MDRLPKRKELIFNRARKTLYLRLTTVIRSLGTKFQNTVDREFIWQCVDRIRILESWEASRSKSVQPVWCVYLEIRYVILLYQLFIIGENGDHTHTRKLEAGITRLEWLRGNWDDLTIDGDLKHGYSLVLKPNKS